MPGETDLQKLLRDMQPELNEGEHVFCTVNSLQEAVTLRPLCLFQEQEAVTVIITKQQAEAAALSYANTFAWITLTIHSSLEAVGLTAAVAKVLTAVNISCNVVAAYYHDHIFVPMPDAKRAIDVLMQLAKQETA